MTPEARTIAFQKLKPFCVDTSKSILAFKKQRLNGHEVVRSIARLVKVLDEERARLPNKATEDALRCVSMLISRGWHQETPPQLCEQLLILLNSLLAQKEHQKGPELPLSDETKLAALECLSTVFLFLPISVDDSCESPQDDSTIVLANTINTILDIIRSSESMHVQVAAINSVTALIEGIRQKHMLRDFLPGIVSCLVQIIQPQIYPRRSYRVLVAALDALNTLLQAVSRPKHSDSEDNSLVETRKWAQKHSVQLKTALSKVAKVKDHERVEVQLSLFKLCMMVAKFYKDILPELQRPIIETLVSLSYDKRLNGEEYWGTEVLELLQSNKQLADHLRMLLHAWLSDLPKILQSTDERKQKDRIRHISFSYTMLKRLKLDLSHLHDIFIPSLLESLQILLPMAPCKGPEEVDANTYTFTDALAHSPSSPSISNGTFGSAIVGASAPLQSLQNLVGKLINQQLDLVISGMVVRNITTANPRDSLAYMWLAVCLVQKLEGITPEKTAVSSSYCGRDYDRIFCNSSVLEVAYSKALEILTLPTGGYTDWKIQLLSLEIVTVKARRSGRFFSPELVDTLFPVIERLGAPQPVIRDAAKACLHVFAKASGILSLPKLIVQNVDYLVNAIATRINSFDMSLPTSQVLIMMVQLSGPDLLPFLDDIIDSIMSMLASYHGYPLLVESLISVLGAIIEQVPRPAPLRIDESIPVNRLKDIEIEDILEIVARFPENHQQGSRATKDYTTPLVKETDQSAEAQDVDVQKTDDVDDANTKVLNIIKSIIRLAQYHLTTDSTSIQLRLLKLVGEGCRALANHEDEYLPLLNDIWPVTVQRLYSTDANVCVAASETLGIMFQTAGDFLSTRVHDEWRQLGSLIRAASPATSSHDCIVTHKAKFTTGRRKWGALLDMVICLILHIRVTALMEDDLIDILTPYAENESQLRYALEHLNADAFWLKTELFDRERNKITVNKTPIFEGSAFKSLQCLGRDV